MKNKYTFFILVTLLLLNGCVYDTEDHSSNKELWGGYDSKKEYKLLRDVFIIRVPSHFYLSSKFIVTTEGSYKRKPGRFFSGPRSIEEYKNGQIDPAFARFEEFPVNMHVVGVIESGTKVKCEELSLSMGWGFMYGWFKNLTPWARIIDGPFSGTLVDIKDVSIYYRDGPDEVFKYKPEDGVIGLTDAT